MNAVTTATPVAATTASAPGEPVAVAALDDLAVGEGRTFAVHGRQVAIFRLRSGALHAVDAVCPHRQGPLADGLIDDGVVVCPLHGHTYDLRTGADVSGAEPGVCVHEATVGDDGIVSVRLASLPTD